MALFQMLGGKYVAKLENTSYGSALKISLYSSLATAVLLTILGKIGLLSSLGVGGNIFLGILLSLISLAYVTKIKWKCVDYITAIKASSINLIIVTIYWSIMMAKISQLL